MASPSDDLISGDRPNPHTSRNAAPPEHLPFSQKMQSAILGWVLADRVFFTQCVAKVQQGWFENTYHQRIWRAISDFHTLYTRCPTDEEMLSLADVRSEEPGFKAQFKAALVASRNARTEIGLDVIRAQMGDWMEAVVLFRSIKLTAEHHSSNRFKDAVNAFKAGAVELGNVRFQEGDDYDFTKWDEQFAEDEKELDDALTTGLKALDQNLTPQANKGGLLIGDTTLVMAPIGGGKTSVLVTLAAANAMAQKDVLFIAHEGRPNEIRNRLLCNLLSRPAQDLWVTNTDLRDAYKNPVWRKRLQFVTNEILTQYLVFVPMVKGGTTVEATMAAVRAKTDEHMAKTGRRFKMIVCDYPGKETTEQVRTVKMETRHKLEIIYNYWSDLATELKTHNVVAWQTNRDGFKVSRGRGKEDRLLDLDDGAECYAVAAPMAVVLTCNIDPVSKNMTYLLAKTRNNEKKIAVTCQSRLSSGMTHHEQMNSCWFDGVLPLGERTAEMLKKYSGGQIDPGDLHGY